VVAEAAEKDEVPIQDECGQVVLDGLLGARGCLCDRGPYLAKKGMYSSIFLGEAAFMIG